MYSVKTKQNQSKQINVFVQFVSCPRPLAGHECELTASVRPASGLSREHRGKNNLDWCLIKTKKMTPQIQTFLTQTPTWIITRCSGYYFMFWHLQKILVYSLAKHNIIRVSAGWPMTVHAPPIQIFISKLIISIYWQIWGKYTSLIYLY